MPSEADVFAALRHVQDPDLHRDIVSLGFIKDLKIAAGAVSFAIDLTTPACPVKDQLKAEAERHVKALPGVTSVDIRLIATPRPKAGPAAPILPGVRHLIAIASGKGGVGKSTTAAALAVALARAGATVGILDADVYGPSIPTMFAATERPAMNAKQQLVPLERAGIKLMSMGLLTEASTPVVWRGPIATQMVRQFLGAVDWGTLDYLLVDLPPGTGDIQLTLVQGAPLTGAVIVTTPQEVALGVAKRGLGIFGQTNVPILGLIENMSGFECPSCHTTTAIFKQGGGRAAAKELNLPFLGAVPLDPETVLAGDAGEPVVLRAPKSPAAQAFRTAAGELARQAAIATEGLAEAKAHPAKVEPAGPSGMRIVWDDGHESRYSYRALRLACPCAACVDEFTGEKRLDPASVPADVHALMTGTIGRYALNFRWSDGHDSGIYTYGRLRVLCECPACKASAAVAR